jgi:uncharacterized membrane protein YdjX (TVP38/TMEM64 family)
LGTIGRDLLDDSRHCIEPNSECADRFGGRALYGHVWGTIYVLLGAEAGALIAFSIARLLGYEMLQRWFGGEMVSADARRVVISVLVLGTLTIVPVIVKLILNRRRKQH